MATAILKSKSTLDASEFELGINKMSQSVASFTSGELAGVAGAIGGAFAVSKILEFGKSVMDTSVELDKQSKTLGINVESLQALYAAGYKADVQQETMIKGLNRLADSQDKVVQMNKQVTQAFRNLGLSAEQVASMGIEELFGNIAKGAENDATAIRDLNEIFGRGMGAELMPLLKDVAVVGLQGIKDAAIESGEAIDQETIAKLKVANGVLKEFKLSCDSLGSKTFAGAITATTNLYDAIIRLATLGRGMSFKDFWNGDLLGNLNADKIAGDIKVSEMEKVVADKKTKKQNSKKIRLPSWRLNRQRPQNCWNSFPIKI